jgi:uncharacterized membrane protein (UPF0127 family)
MRHSFDVPRRLGTLLILFFLSSCGQGADEAVASDIVFEWDRLEIVTKADRHKFNVEIADTSEKRSRGLMFRTEMAPNNGMLFLFENKRRLSFWMKNTYISLDMLFIDERGVIRAIAENTVPESTAGVSSGVRVIAVLELNTGTAKRLDIRIGDRVDHPFFDAK